MRANSESVIFITDEPTHRPRISIGQGMIAVAGSAVIFAVFGVNQAAAIVIGAFFVSACVTRPEVWQGWVLLSMAAVAALPFILIAAMYTFTIRAALFLGHWPTSYNPYPKKLARSLSSCIAIPRVRDTNSRLGRRDLSLLHAGHGLCNLATAT